jgi:hypothetical protein
MRIGYERVSTADQSLALQHDALTTAGCQQFYTEHASDLFPVREEVTRERPSGRGSGRSAARRRRMAGDEGPGRYPGPILPQ